MRFIISSFLVILFFNVTTAQNLPVGFSLVEVTDELENISCFTFIDEDTALLANQSGYVYLIQNNDLIEDQL